MYIYMQTAPAKELLRNFLLSFVLYNRRNNIPKHSTFIRSYCLRCRCLVFKTTRFAIILFFLLSLVRMTSSWNSQCLRPSWKSLMLLDQRIQHTQKTHRILTVCIIIATRITICWTICQEMLPLISIIGNAMPMLLSPY